jgi:hypothetical protein
MSDHNTRSIFEEILLSLDIPESAYEKAEARYKDLGEWFDQEESLCSPFSPHIYPQGSFRLGTVVRPVTGPLEYDLDLGCRLRFGITKFTHTQEQLKNLVGADLEAYRKARQIESALEEKNRCWRLPYKDEVRSISTPFLRSRRTMRSRRHSRKPRSRPAPSKPSLRA